MDYSADIRDAGMKAVLEAKEIWNLEQDNEVREEFISALMARNLHKALNTPIRTEVLYTKLYEVLVSPKIPVDIVNQIGLRRADVVIYERPSMLPMGIVEVKKFDESANASGIIEDLHKTKLVVGMNSRVRIYGGVLVCQTTGQCLSSRQDFLQKEVPSAQWSFSGENKVHHQDPNKAWSWSFACATLRV
jgi:hypothetical protein